MPTPEIVTLTEAKMFLRLEQADDYEDALFVTLIDAATESVLSFADGYDPEVTEPSSRIKLAILSHVARAFRDRESGPDAPPGAERLILPFRNLAV